MGCAPDVSLGIGEAAVAYTGGMLARNADAVVMVEHTQAIDAHTIEVMRPVAPGENVAQPGEDVSAGATILPAGHVIRPQDIGALLALGIEKIEVAQRPRVGILSMGDEVVHPGATPGPGQVRDINTYTVAGQVVAAGGIPHPLGLVGDDYEEQLVAARQGLAQSDMLVLSAGSSVSARDRTVDIVADLGEPGPLVHGLALRPRQAGHRGPVRRQARDRVARKPGVGHGGEQPAGAAHGVPAHGLRPPAPGERTNGPAGAGHPIRCRSRRLRARCAWWRVRTGFRKLTRFGAKAA